MGTTNFDTVEAGTAVNELTAAVITSLSTECAGATLASPTAESGEARTVGIQLTDRLGNDIAVRTVVDVFISTEANGDTPGDGSLTITLSAGTDGALLATDENKATFVSEADGDLDVTLTDGAAASDSVWLHVVLPNGELVTSEEIAFAA